ncbi:MAG: HAD-IB family phosphatase [Anaerolineales bacterium]|nr:HAD-IB family phosphatase [Anaerolineales bacterium]
MNIILSDIEGTLTTGSSWRALGRYYLKFANPWAYRLFILRWLPRYLLVELGLFNRRKAMTLWMKNEAALLKGWTRSEVLNLADWIVEQEMWPKRRIDVIQELQARKSSETQIVLVSSAYQPFVEAFARHLDAAAIGSTLLYQQGELIGLSTPVNAYHQKAKNVRDRFNEEVVLAAYGDTASDIPLLELSQEAIAVYPDAELREAAETRGWEILEK